MRGRFIRGRFKDVPGLVLKSRLVEVALEEFDLLLSAGASLLRTRSNLSVTEGEIDDFRELRNNALARIQVAA